MLSTNRANPCLTKLWSKKSKGRDYDKWLPLPTHLIDTAEVARRLWDSWVSRSVVNRISQGITVDGQVDFSIAQSVFEFLAYVHDIGKVSPAFQTQETHGNPDLNDFTRQQVINAGFPLKPNYANSKESRHI